MGKKDELILVLRHKLVFVDVWIRPRQNIFENTCCVPLGAQKKERRKKIFSFLVQNKDDEVGEKN